MISDEPSLSTRSEKELGKIGLPEIRTNHCLITEVLGVSTFTTTGKSNLNDKFCAQNITIP